MLVFIAASAFYALLASQNAISVFAAVIHVGGSITTNTVWAAGNVYVVDSHLTVESSASLIIQPGAIIKISPNKLIGVKGVLKVQGTADNPVTFTSLKDDTVGGDTNGDGTATAPAMGDWAHIAFFDTSVDAENLIEHAVIRYGGYMRSSGYDYYNCYGCEFWGSVRFDSASPTVRSSTVELSKAWALSASVDSFPLVSGNTLRSSEGNGLEIRSGTLATVTPIVKHWGNTDVVYALTGHVTINSGVTLAIDPGLMIKVAPSKLIGVKGVLKVQGTADNPVTFTSLKDDPVGGDTNGDGTATAPAKGDWAHIAFFDSSVDAENLIEHAVIRYGGYMRSSGYDYYNCYGCEFWGSVRFDNASPTVRSTSIVLNKYGAWAKSSQPVLGCNNFENNDNYGFANQTEAVVVNATGQWWGSPSGPSHGSNPMGVGNAVSNGVNFNPWRTSGCGMPPAAPASAYAAGISETQIMVVWVDSAADESTYYIERASADAPNWTVIATLGANSTNYVDGGFTCSSAVFAYRVRAYRQDDGTYSGYSQIAGGATVPCAPMALQFALTGPTAGRLTWADQSPDETEFRVERSLNGGTSWERIATVPASTTQQDVAELGCSQAYQFRVQAYRAQDSLGSGYSDVAAYQSPPCTPGSLTVTPASDGSLMVSWTDASPDEGAFLIERTVDGTNWSQVGVTGANVVTFNDGAVQCSTQYSYRVRSQRSGDGQVSAGYSNTATVTTRPCAPADLKVNAVSTSQVDLRWLDNSPDETGFLILAAANTPGGQSASIGAAANTTTATMGQLACGTPYTFRVRAYRASDNVYSVDSGPVTGATLPCRKVYLPSLKR